MPRAVYGRNKDGSAVYHAEVGQVRMLVNIAAVALALSALVQSVADPDGVSLPVLASAGLFAVVAAVLHIVHVDREARAAEEERHRRSVRGEGWS